MLFLESSPIFATILAMNPLYIALAVLGVLAVWVIFAYNSFVRLVNRTQEAWADIDVQLKRRYDLIPNLVNMVKGYMQHEKQVFERVTELRTRAMQATGLEERAQTENMLTDALKSLFAVSANYPDLKANTNFLELQREVADTENKIQAARRFYNTNVRDLNIALESFPQNFIGNMFNFKRREFFEVEEAGERGPVAVTF